LSDAPDPWNDPRVHRRYRGAALEDGEAWPLKVRGPGQLRVSARAVGEAGAASVPFDLLLRRAANGDVLRRVPTSARIRDGESVPRRLAILTPPGWQEWEVVAFGVASQVDAELWRARPRLFSRRPIAEESVAVGPRAEAAKWLAEGAYGDTAAEIEAWLDDHPADVQALILLALAQGRVLPTSHEALAASELAARQLALDGSPSDDLARAARHAWLQTSAFAFAGVGLPQDADVVIAELPAGHGLGEVDGDGRHLPGVYSRIPPGCDVRLQAPGHDDAQRWTVVNARGLNRTGEAAVVQLSVDGGEPVAVNLAEGWTRLRLALPPGERRVRIEAPGGPAVSIGVDLPIEDAVADDHGPYLRAMHAARIDAERPEARFTLPRGVGPAHVRVDAWWDGLGPRELVLNSGLGRRRLVLHPAQDGPRLLWPADDGSLTSGTAVVDLEAGVEWVSVTAGGDPAFVRVAARSPTVRGVDVPSEANPADLAALAASDLRQVSRDIAAGDSPDLRLARAGLLLELDLPAYAERDMESAIAKRPANDSPSPDELRAAVVQQRGPRHVRVAGDPSGSVLLLGRPDTDGPADDPGVLLAAARDALTAAELDAEQAVTALAFATAAREHAEDAEAVRIVQAAARATRENPLSVALSSPDRVTLTGPRTAPDPDVETRAWAREAMLGAPLRAVDRVLGAGTRWVVALGDDAPRELTVEALCDDLRVPELPGLDECHVEIRAGERAVTAWTIPVGEVASTTVATERAGSFEVALAAGGSARYMAVGLSAPGWRVPDRRATFHVARPGDPVRFAVAGPTLLTLEAAPRSGTDEAAVELLVDGSQALASRWTGGLATLRSDLGEGFGPLRQLRTSLLAKGTTEIEIRSSGAPVAVRLSHRVPRERVLPPAPPAEESRDVSVDGATAPWATCAAVDGVARLPKPARGGTVESGVWLWQRWSVDDERSDRAHRSVELAATHRLGVKRSAWFSGGLFARVWPDGPPSAGARLSVAHRLRPVDLRVTGQAQGLVQRVGEQARGAVALRARLDRPTRIGPGLTLVPYVKVRGYLHSQESLYAWRDVADPEMTSAYRREHPFGLGAGASLLWRPWINGEWALGLRATSNPDPASLDNAGGYLAFRAYLRPVGLEFQGDVSRRFADAWRVDAWWRGEVSLRVWMDLGPPTAWIRPDVRVAYLFDPRRLDLTLGVTFTPGRRAATHFGPLDLLFDDLREPVESDGRWRR